MKKYIFYLLALSLLLGCSESKTHYENGMYWLSKENNWEMAARSFKRAIDAKPNYWKAHIKLIEALSIGGDPKKYLPQLRITLAQFPDSARSSALVEPGMKLIGYNEYNKISAQYELNNLGAKLAKNPKNFTILARCIMAGCRAGDKIAAVDYYQRAIALVGYDAIDDSLKMELRFFIGTTMMDWLRFEKEIERNPQDASLYKEQLQVGLIFGDSVMIGNKIQKFVDKFPSEVDDEFIRLYGSLVSHNVFKSTKMLSGWDASLSSDKRKVLFLKDMGNEEYGDLYIYRRSVKGGENYPVLKAAQQNLESLAWPVFSPNGKWVYFYGSPEKNWAPGKFGDFNLYRVGLKYGSDPKKLTDRNFLCTPLQFTTDGKLLLVKRETSSVRPAVEIVLLDPDSKKIEVLSRIGEPVKGAVFTPSGDSLLFITDRGVFRRAIDGGKISVDLTWLGIKFPQLSPDGKILKFVNAMGHTLLIDRETGIRQFLGSFGNTRVAFGNDNRLIVTQVEGDQLIVSQLDYLTPKISLAEFKQVLQH